MHTNVVHNGKTNAEPSPVISPATSDDTIGIPISGCLARSPASFYKGGDTFGTGNDDATNIGADDDYFGDITVAHVAWDPWPTQE